MHTQPPLRPSAEARNVPLAFTRTQRPRIGSADPPVRGLTATLGLEGSRLMPPPPIAPRDLKTPARPPRAPPQSATERERAARKGTACPAPPATSTATPASATVAQADEGQSLDVQQRVIPATPLCRGRGPAGVRRARRLGSKPLATAPGRGAVGHPEARRRGDPHSHAEGDGAPGEVSWSGDRQGHRTGLNQ